MEGLAISCGTLGATCGITTVGCAICTFFSFGTCIAVCGTAVAMACGTVIAGCGVSTVVCTVIDTHDNAADAATRPHGGHDPIEEPEE